MRYGEQIVLIQNAPPLRCGRAIYFRRRDMLARVCGDGPAWASGHDRRIRHPSGSGKTTCALTGGDFGNHPIPCASRLGATEIRGSCATRAASNQHPSPSLSHGSVPVADD
jgi:hypothetical protein